MWSRAFPGSTVRGPHLVELGGHATTLPRGSPPEAVHQAVTRQSYLGRTPEDWQPAQRLTIEQALRLFTIDAAHGTFEEDAKGSLAPGNYADLVVLSDNPLPADLRAIEALATVVGGRTEHCAERVKDANMCS